MSLKSLEHNSIYKISIFFVIFIMLLATACQDSITKEEDNEEKEGPKPVAYFKISFENPSNTNKRFSPETVSDTTNDTLTITSNTSYERYRIDFTGDVNKLPDPVSVTITWTQQDATSFYWGSDDSFTGTLTINVPRGGGTIGVNGTLINTTPNFRPAVNLETPGTLGTVKFEADLVHTLTCTIVRED